MTKVLVWCFTHTIEEQDTARALGPPIECDEITLTARSTNTASVLYGLEPNVPAPCPKAGPLDDWADTPQSEGPCITLVKGEHRIVPIRNIGHVFAQGTIDDVIEVEVYRFLR